MELAKETWPHHPPVCLRAIWELFAHPVLKKQSMRDSFIIEQAGAALRSMDDDSPEEWFATMERLGILDAEGNDLRPMPEPPKKPKGNHKSATPRRPRIT
jgi:hypothetical protein